ncbi:MAG: EamA family transporter [Blastocatellia bacterium]|nr:EamA family transporter [Blastocatellia bacterium]
MRSHFAPIVMIIFGGALYHVAQKSVPRTVNPFAAIMFAYGIGATLCAIGLAFDRSGATFLNSIKNSNWAVVALGVGALIIEVGFLLAYRAGWNISLASVVTNISVTVILIPIGLLVFKEHLSLRSVAGIACCLLGLYLISKK